MRDVAQLDPAVQPVLGEQVRGTGGEGSIPATGAGVLMMWFPSLWAFRAGKVESYGATYWDLASIGAGSVAFGENTRASGANSFAANLATTSSPNSIRRRANR